MDKADELKTDNVSFEPLVSAAEETDAESAVPSPRPDSKEDSAEAKDAKAIDVGNTSKKSYGYAGDSEYSQMRLEEAVNQMNGNYDILMRKYGYLIGKGNGCGRLCNKLSDIFGAIFITLLVFLPFLLIWLLVNIFFFLFWLLFLRFYKLSFINFVRLRVGMLRLKLLQADKKSGCCYQVMNRMVGFAQMLDFLVSASRGEIAQLIWSLRDLFANSNNESEAFPFLSALLTTRHDVAMELIHKPTYFPSKQNDDNPVFRDRESKTVFATELGSFIPLIGAPAALSIADGRHEIGRKIVFIMCNVEEPEEFLDFESYYANKFNKTSRDKLADDTSKWLSKYLTYRKLTSGSVHGVYYAITFWRMFGYRMTNDEIDMLDQAIGGLRLMFLPDWFLFLLGNNRHGRKSFVWVHQVATIIETKCADSPVTQRLLQYGQELGLKDDKIVLYVAAFSFLFAGGNLLLRQALNRIGKDPKNEYIKFRSNPRLYTLETARTHAANVRCVASVASHPYTLKLRDRYHTVPAGTVVGVSLVHMSDTMAVTQADQHVVPRAEGRDAYGEMLTFHMKDKYFDTKSRSGGNHLSARFCPGRIFIEPHLEQILELVFERVKEEFRWDDDDNDPTNNYIDVEEIVMDRVLSKYHKVVMKALVPGVEKHNKKKVSKTLPDVVSAKEADKQPDVYKDFSKTKVFGLKLLKQDIYFPRSLVKDTVLGLITEWDWLFPVEDDNTPFDEESVENNRKVMKKFMKEHISKVMPTINVEWKGLKSDEEISLFAFGGLVCGYISVILKDSDDPDSYDYLAPNNAVYKSDVTYLERFEVRQGLYRYGACAYFDAEFKLVGIYVSHMKSVVLPGSDEMPYAKYVWTTTILASLTLKEHALEAHMMESASLVKNVYEKLGFDHWLRRLLTPFTFRTVYINLSLEKALMPENGMVHRIWGFTYKSLGKLAKTVVDNYEFIPYAERYDEKMHEVDDAVFPLHKDSNDLYQINYNFVYNYVSNYDAMNDKEAEAFYYALCGDLKIHTDSGGDGEYSVENLCKLLANLICVVTAWHEQVGGVFDVMGIELDWHDTKLYKNKKFKTCQSANDFVGLTLLVLLTGARNPQLLNDFTQVLLKDEKYDENKKIFDNWQLELKQLADEIDERNKSRRIPFMCANPRVLECSLSI